MRVGFRTGLDFRVPLAALGLPDNYSEPLPAIWAFGSITTPLLPVTPIQSSNPP